MPRRKRHPLKPLPDRIADWSRAGLPTLPAVDPAGLGLTGLLGQWIDWFQKTPPKPAHEMYCFIYYDIESNKIRRMVAKLLERQGCVRVQKSVFFARIHRKRYTELTGLLRQIQQLYENEDSIMLLPVGEDMLNSLQCIGQAFDLEMITAPKNTLFI